MITNNISIKSHINTFPGHLKFKNYRALPFTKYIEFFLIIDE